MKECMRSHISQKQYLAVLKKYCDPGIIRQVMGMLVSQQQAAIFKPWKSLSLIVVTDFKSFVEYG